MTSVVANNEPDAFADAEIHVCREAHLGEDANPVYAEDADDGGNVREQNDDNEHYF